MVTVTERDAELSKIREKYEKNLLALNERQRWLTSLEQEKTRLQEANSIALNENTAITMQWSGKVEHLNKEKEQYSSKLDETQERILDVSRRLDVELEVNKALKEQVNELINLNKAIHTSASHRRPQQSNNPAQERMLDRNESGDEEDDEHDARDEVVILHDSLCRKINDSLLSREKVSVKKVWAPDMERMEEALDNVNAKVVVLQAWTRDLDKMEVDEMNQKIAGLVSKALSRCEKVVVSTIIRREDVEDIDLKADLVNAHVILKYKRNESVIVCDNFKLYDSKFRNNDKLHLNDDGVPIFASNLKYAIAEAVGVEVQQKRRSNYDQRNEYDDRRHGFGNDRRRYERS